MKILFITHADFEKPGYIETWGKQNNYVIQEVRPYLGEKLPDAHSFDFLVVMGGPQSPLTINDTPYLNDEITIIKQAIKQNKRIMGVCLGAQLIGEALGAKTERSPYREVGMYPIELLEAAKTDKFFRNLPAKFDVMHWHSDMPGISIGSEVIAASAGCLRQIIRYGEKIYGFQCHLELTQDLIKKMIKNCMNDMAPGKYIYTAEQLMAVHYSEINARLREFLNYLANLP